jgi:acetyltransferase-like isoleucine patch superfamily enzyme
MVRNICHIIRSMILPSSKAQSSWEKYKDFIKIHPTVIIDPVSSIKIFNPPDPPRICLEIGEGSHIFSTFALLRPQAKITIGNRCQLGASQFVCAEAITVGDDVLMAWGITVVDTDSHALDWEHRKHDVAQAYNDYREDKSNLIRNKDWMHVESRPITIGDRSWIGFNAAILKGVTVGDNAVVGACTVVARNVFAYTVVSGNPAAVVKDLKQGEH